MPAVAESFPNAVNIIDKFHIKQALVKALDKVRKEELEKPRKPEQALFRGRRLFMAPKDRLTKGQAEKLDSLSKEYPKTGRAHRFAAFDGFCKCATTEEASFAFGRLCSRMHRLPESRRPDGCRLEPMKEAAATLRKSQGEYAGLLPLFSLPAPFVRESTP